MKYLTPFNSVKSSSILERGIIAKAPFFMVIAGGSKEFISCNLCISRTALVPIQVCVF